MDPNVPAGAALLLDFIGRIEAPGGYGVIYANKQAKLKKPLTSMTVDEVIAAQVGWSKHHGSSAAGRYQFMRATLRELKAELGLRGEQHFDADLQDRLGYHLLKRRGYEKFVNHQLGPIGFGKALAQEWASLPVLSATKGAHRDIARGETYYAGDKLNKVLTTPAMVEGVLSQVLALRNAKPAPQPIPAEPVRNPAPAPVDRSGAAGWFVLIAAAIAGALAASWGWIVAVTGYVSPWW